MPTMIDPSPASVQTGSPFTHTPPPIPTGTVNLFVRICTADDSEIQLYTLRKISHGFTLTDTHSINDPRDSCSVYLDWDGEVGCNCALSQNKGHCHHAAALAALAKLGHVDFGDPIPEPDWDEMAEMTRYSEKTEQGLKYF